MLKIFKWRLVILEAKKKNIFWRQNMEAKSYFGGKKKKKNHMTANGRHIKTRVKHWKLKSLNLKDFLTFCNICTHKDEMLKIFKLLYKNNLKTKKNILSASSRQIKIICE